MGVLAEFNWFAVNSFAWLGWIWIAWCAYDDADKADWQGNKIVKNVMRIEYGVSLGVYVLQGICWLEVFRMLTGSLKGNTVVGVTLHGIRTFMMLVVLPIMGEDVSSRAVLYVWAATEFCRYPYYMLGSSATAILRYTAPIILFPLGAGSEVYTVYLAEPKLEGIERILAGVMVFINIFGGMYTEFIMVRKGIQVLKAGGKEKSSSAKKDVAKERTD